MIYKPLNEKFYKTYVVQRTTGFGDQGGEPTRWHEYLDSFDTLQEAIEFGNKRFPRDPSGWTYENYTIVINTLTDNGREEYNRFQDKFQQMEEYIKDNPEKFTTYYADGFSIVLENNAAFDNV